MGCGSSVREAPIDDHDDRNVDRNGVFGNDQRLDPPAVVLPESVESARAEQEGHSPDPDEATESETTGKLQRGVTDPEQQIDVSDPDQEMDVADPEQQTDVADPEQLTDETYLVQKRDGTDPEQQTDVAVQDQEMDVAEPEQQTYESDPEHQTDVADPAQQTDVADSDPMTPEATEAELTSAPEADRPTDRKPEVGRWRLRMAIQGAFPFRLDDSRQFEYVAVQDVDNRRRMGRDTVTIDTRAFKDDVTKPRPEVEAGVLWEDPEFDEDVAFAGLNERVFFVRPKEFCEKPALFTDGTTRFDVEQGSVGTCYFLSVIATLAEKKDILDQVFVSRDYDPFSDTYDGVLHVRFWRFGRWIDVYIDDRLPVYSSGTEKRIWAAKSQDPNELWVTLLEKAYTKEFAGSYKKIFGGLTTEAFVRLTGGVSERFLHDVDLEKIGTSGFFSRLTTALKNGSLVTCSTKGERDGFKGLIGDHAYTVTGSGLVSLRGAEVPLLRIRNPWGSGEWQGAWSDDSEEWQAVADDVKQALNVEGKVDGEFWMNMDDYLDNYEDTVISNLTPDFDGDGKEDGLDNVCSILGEWQGHSAAGSGNRKFDNPTFYVIVPDQVDSAQVVIQCMQENVKGTNGERHFVRVDLYSVDAVLANGYSVYDEITNNLTYTDASQVSYRYNLKPGRYIMIPSTFDEGKEGQFLLRTFSSVTLTCQEMTDIPKHVVRSSDLQFECNRTVYNTPILEYIPGAWHENNAGGQIANDSFATNPQYLLHISGANPVPVTILLMQDSSSELPLGFKLWKREDQSLPLDLQQIYSCYDSALNTTEGSGVFVISSEAEGTFLLESGDYILLLFTDEPANYKDFILCLATAEGCQITHEDYNQ